MGGSSVLGNCQAQSMVRRIRTDSGVFGGEYSVERRITKRESGSTSQWVFTLGLERDSLEGAMNVMNHFGQGSELQSVVQAQTELEENLLGWLL